jgi:hypothetical protein
VYHIASLEDEALLCPPDTDPFAFSLVDAFTNEFNKWSLAYDRFRSVISSP